MGGRRVVVGVASVAGASGRRRAVGRECPDVGRVMLEQTGMMGTGQEETVLHSLQDAQEPDSTLQFPGLDPVGDILREHGPSMGKTSDPTG